MAIRDQNGVPVNALPEISTITKKNAQGEHYRTSEILRYPTVDTQLLVSNNDAAQREIHPNIIYDVGIPVDIATSRVDSAMAQTHRWMR